MGGGLQSGLQAGLKKKVNGATFTLKTKHSPFLVCITLFKSFRLASEGSQRSQHLPRKTATSTTNWFGKIHFSLASEIEKEITDEGDASLKSCIIFQFFL